MDNIKFEMWSKEFEFVRLDLATKGPKFSGTIVLFITNLYVAHFMGKAPPCGGPQGVYTSVRVTVFVQ